MVCSKNQSFIQGTLLISTSKYYDYFPLPCQVIFEVLLCLFWADFTCLIFTKILCLYRNKIFRQGKWVKRHKILLNKENFFWCHRPRNINVKNFRTLIFYAKSYFWRKKHVLLNYHYFFLWFYFQETISQLLWPITWTSLFILIMKFLFSCCFIFLKIELHILSVWNWKTSTGQSIL